MPKEAKVEKYNLTKEQIGFMKNYKKTMNAHKILAKKLNQSLTEADMYRNALSDIEGNLNDLVNQAKNFKFGKMEGQEVIEEKPEETENIAMMQGVM